MMHSVSAFVAVCCMIAVQPAAPGSVLRADAGGSTTSGVLGLRQLQPDVTEETEDDRSLLLTEAGSPHEHFDVAASRDFVKSRATSDEADTQDAGLGRKGKHRHRQQQNQYRVLLENADNVQYFGDAMIGNPPQRMKILFDTGSSDTWVPAVGCTSCGLHSGFDDVASSTAVAMGRSFSNRYDSGSVEGSVIKESMVIGGMAVKKVEMGLVKRQGQRIQGFKADGIVGLAFPSISTTQNTSPSQHSTFVQLLQEQFGGTGDLFSVYLTPSPNQPGSMVIFGGYDLDLVRRPRAKDRKHSQQQTTALAQTGSGDDKARRETRSTVGRQPAVGRAHHEVWRRGEAQKASLRGGGSLALKQQQQQQQQQAQARVHAQGSRNASQEGSGSSGEAGWGHGGPFAIGVREMSSSGINHGMTGVGAGGERGGGGLPSPSTGRMELASEGSFTERRHGTAKGSAVAAKQRLAAATAEEIGETRERKDTGHAHADHTVGDSDNDHDDDDDEPVIVWTPVVEYRGSLSYWTVQLTGWRTETATDGSSSSSDGGSAAAIAGGRWQHTRSNLSAADGQDGGGHTAATAGIATTAGPEMCPDGCQAIVDTGSSLLVPPRSQYREVMRQIIGGRADCRYRYGMTSCSECGSPDDFPDIVISVAVAPPPEHVGGAAARRRPMKSVHGDSEAGIINDGRKHNRRRTGGGGGGGGVVGGGGGGGGSGSRGGGGGGGGGTGWSQEFRLKPSDYLSQSWDGCEVLIGEGRATDIWTLGDAFIKTYMTIFDVANLRVGFVCPDGGRCLGGNPAAAPWRPPTHFCWPFPGRSTADQDSADRLGGTYCLYLHYSFLGWALMATSVLLFLVGCLFAAYERGSRGGGATSLVAVPSSSPSAQQNSSTLSNPPLPLLFTARPERRCQQAQRQQQHPRSRRQEQPELVEDDAEAVRGGNGRSGGGPLSPVGGGMAAARRKTPENRRGGRQPGGGSGGGVPLRWAQGSKDFLFSFAGKSAAAAGWVVSLAAAATNARQQWFSPRDGRRRKA